MNFQKTTNATPHNFENETIAAATGTGMIALLMASAAITIVTGDTFDLHKAATVSTAAATAASAALLGAYSTSLCQAATEMSARRSSRQDS